MDAVTVLHYRRQYGQMERVKRRKEKVLGSGRNHSGHSYRRMGYWLVVIATCCTCIVGCTTLKTAGITSIAAGGGALAGSVLSSGVLAPTVGATTTAFVADVVMETKNPSKTGSVLHTEQGVIECAPDNIWSLLEKLVGVGGWFLILLFVVPMSVSYTHLTLPTTPYV